MGAAGHCQAQVRLARSFCSVGRAAAGIRAARTDLILFGFLFENVGQIHRLVHIYRIYL